MQHLKTIFIILWIMNSFVQTNAYSFGNYHLSDLRIDSLIYNIGLQKYESLNIEDFYEKKREIIKLAIDESELGLSQPILLENNLIILKENGRCFAFDLQTKKRNEKLEIQLNSIKLDRLVLNDGILCGCQLNEKKYLGGRINTKSDNRYFTFSDSMQWELDSNLNEKNLDALMSNPPLYKDQFLLINSSYSHYVPNTRVEFADKTKLEFWPRVNSVVKNNDEYYVLTNREFMNTGGPSIYKLMKDINNLYSFVEVYQIDKIAFITSFNLNNSILYLCKSGDLNFLCHYRSGQFYLNSTFPSDTKLDYFTYNVQNQDNQRILLSNSLKNRIPSAQRPMYIIEQDRIITIQLN